LADSNVEEKEWIIKLAKNATYIPYPLTSLGQFLGYTIVTILLLALGFLGLYSTEDIPLRVMSGLTIGSTLFCYALSIYETILNSKRNRHYLK
jgi:hypothetical protein